MNIKKLAASLMVLSLCTVGVGNINALKNAEPLITVGVYREVNGERVRVHIPVVQGTNRPVLEPGSQEEQLFDALCRAGFDPLDARNNRHVVTNMGLKKYLTELINAGFMEKVAGLHSNFAVKSELGSFNKQISSDKAQHSSDKAEQVRAGIAESTTYVNNLNVIVTFAENIGRAATRADFQQALDGLNRLNLDALANTIDRLEEGKSARSLQNHKDALERLKTLVAALIDLGIEKITAGEEALVVGKEQAKMSMLHLALVQLSAMQVIPDDMLNEELGRFDPPSAANGNKSLLERYNEWVNANNTLMPEVGEATAAFEARCEAQGKTPYPGFERP